MTRDECDKTLILFSSTKGRNLNTKSWFTPLTYPTTHPPQTLRALPDEVGRKDLGWNLI